MPDGIRVTVEDLSTGTTESTVIWDDYVLVVAGSAYLAHIQTHPTTGTYGLTVKGVRRD